MNPLLIPELRELIQEKNEQELRNFLERLHPAQAAELIEGLKPEELCWILEILSDDKEALIFEYIPEDIQLDLASGVGRPALAKLVVALAPDDRAEFVRKLPPKIVDEILPLMAQAERYDIKRLLSFSEETSGYRMTTEYASIPMNLSCGEALAKIRAEAPDKETIYSIYVVDADRHLEGVVSLKDLLLSRAETPLSRITRSEIFVVRADEPATKAAELIKKYDLLALPVVDDLGRLLGIVTVDDLIDVMEREATRDILSLGGVEPGALDKPYFDNPLTMVVRRRVVWLLLLFVASMFTGAVLRHYDDALAKVIALSFFIPLLIGSGGNAGSQTVSTIIRSLALKEISLEQWPRVVLREASVGLTLGMILGVLGFIRVLASNPSGVDLALTVALTLAAICAWANLVAACVPLLAQRAGLDATVLSAPLITTLVDATGLLIYFSIALVIITRLSGPEIPPTAEFVTQLRVVAEEAPPQMKLKMLELIEPVGKPTSEFVDKVNALANEAPPQLRDRLHEIVQAPELTHAHDWLFPVIGLAVLGLIAMIVWRRNAAADPSKSK